MTNQEKALWRRIRAIERRLGIASGGVPPSIHATNHGAGSSDPIDILDLDGYPNSSPATQFLREDGIWATPAGAGGSLTGPGTSTDKGIPRWVGAGGDELDDTTGPVMEDDGRISGLTDPTGPQDAATKAYVDGASAFVVAATWTYSTDVATVDLSVSGYSDVLVFIYGVTATTGFTGIRAIRLSVDGGSTFYATSGDYKQMATTGVISDAPQITPHNTLSVNARYTTTILHGININGTVKSIYSYTGNVAYLFTGSQSPVTHVRVFNTGGGNLTGGSITILGRPL